MDRWSQSEVLSQPLVAGIRDLVCPDGLRGLGDLGQDWIQIRDLAIQLFNEILGVAGDPPRTRRGPSGRLGGLPS